MAIDAKALQEFVNIKYSDWNQKFMASEYLTTKWKQIPIPNGWYAILFAYTAKYALNIEVKQDPDYMMYDIDVTAGDKHAGFSITTNAAKEDVKCLALADQLEWVVKNWGLTDYESMEKEYKKFVKPGIVDQSSAWTWDDNGPITLKSVPLTISNKPTGYKSISWGKITNKLNSLYEMYGMVDPKPNRFCKQHRPTVAQFLAKIAEAEKQTEIQKTINDLSPTLKDTMLKVAEKYLKKDDAFFKYFSESPGKGYAGEYYTDYGKQLEAKANQAIQGGAVSKTVYDKVKTVMTTPCPHEWHEIGNGHTQCKFCGWPDPGCIGCAAAAKKAQQDLKLSDLPDDPEDLF